MVFPRAVLKIACRVMKEITGADSTQIFALHLQSEEYSNTALSCKRGEIWKQSNLLKEQKM